MNIGIITVKDSSYHPNRRLGEAAAARGHQVVLIHPYRLWPILSEDKAGVVGQPDIEDIDIVLPRQGATIGDSCQALIAHFSLMGIPVVNDLSSVLRSKNQFHTLQALMAAHVPVPDTLFVNSAQGFKDALSRLAGYPVVVKQVSGRQGQGVILVETRQDLDAVVDKLLDKREGLLVQRFISPAGRRDIRVLVVGGKVIGAMELKPPKGDFRANYHLSKDSRGIDI